MSLPMIETHAGATEGCRIEALLPDGRAVAAPAPLTRQQRRLVDKINVEDGRWFARHPDQHERVRPIVRGEFAPLVEEAGWTHVRVIRMGRQRARLPFTDATPRNTPASPPPTATPDAGHQTPQGGQP